MTNLKSFYIFQLPTKTALFILGLFLNSYCSFSQNLVPNPNFEEIFACPTGLNQFENAKDWKAIMNSPDYLNRCAIGWSSVPQNLAGYQETITGDGYAGLAMGFGQNGDFHEMIGIEITMALDIGSKYYFSFSYVSGYNNLTISHCTCFSSGLGVKFLTNFVDTIGLGPSLIDNSAVIFSDTILKDTLQWNLFNGSFVADSAYRFLIIGNFFTSSFYSKICLDSLGNIAYTYIDNVCLSASPNGCNSTDTNSTTLGFSVFPTLGSNTLYVKHNSKDNFEPFNITVYNYLGKKVLNYRSEGGEIQLDLSSFSRSVYFVCIDEFVYKIILI